MRMKGRISWSGKIIALTSGAALAKTPRVIAFIMVIALKKSQSGAFRAMLASLFIIPARLILMRKDCKSVIWPILWLIAGTGCAARIMLVAASIVISATRPVLFGRAASGAATIKFILTAQPARVNVRQTRLVAAN